MARIGHDALGTESGPAGDQADGSFEASAAGTMTIGNFYLEAGKLRYRSSRSDGAAALSGAKTILTVEPEGGSSVLIGRFERVQ